MIDYSALVLGPAMAIFAGPVTVTPLVSQPGVAAYPARGSYSSKPVTIQLEGSDDFHQTQQMALGIRVSEYSVCPQQGDTMVRTPGVALASGTLPDGTFKVFNVEFDGQGGANLILRETDR